MTPFALVLGLIAGSIPVAHAQRADEVAELEPAVDTRLSLEPASATIPEQANRPGTNPSRGEDSTATDASVAGDAGPAPAAGPRARVSREADGPAAAQSGVAGAPTRIAALPAAVDRLDLGTTSITGNQELPKVLYIVPWKQSDLGELIGRPANTLLDEVLSPVDRRVFDRHLSYYEALHGDSQEE